MQLKKPIAVLEASEEEREEDDDEEEAASETRMTTTQTYDSFKTPVKTRMPETSMRGTPWSSARKNAESSPAYNFSQMTPAATQTPRNSIEQLESTNMCLKARAIVTEKYLFSQRPEHH